MHIIFPKLVDLAGAEYIDGMDTRIIFTTPCRSSIIYAGNTDDLWLRWAALLARYRKACNEKI